MGAMREAWNRVLSFFHKRERDSEMEAELASHVELAVEENMRQGMPEAEARRKALVRFGGVQQAKERQREARGLAVARRVDAGCSLHVADVAAGPLVYGGGGADPGAGHWREYCGVQRGEYDFAAAAAVSGFATAGSNHDQRSQGRRIQHDVYDGCHPGISTTEQIVSAGDWLFRVFFLHQLQAGGTWRTAACNGNAGDGELLSDAGSGADVGALVYRRGMSAEGPSSGVAELSVLETAVSRRSRHCWASDRSEWHAGDGGGCDAEDF